MTRVYQPLLEPLDLTYPQYMVMTALWSDDGRTVSSLGQELSLESNTLTPLLKRLEGAGLISRNRSTDDERRVVVTLTDTGRAMEALASDIPACILAATGLSASELADLTRRIHEVKAALDGGQQ
jgi:DNA-binding MarR family transcriptional regulator